MTIQLSDIGKRFGKQWLFRNFNAEYTIGDRIGISGINGSGKSTLLQLIAGISLPTEGKLEYKDIDGASIDLNNLAGRLALISPYMDLPEQLTLSELYHFHASFTPFQDGIDLQKFQEITLLENKENSLVKSFSSGMKQRLKLGLCFLSQVKILMLDEPCSNLDHAGKSLYLRFLEEYSKDRIIFIASNEEDTELKDCNLRINLMDFKKD